MCFLFHTSCISPLPKQAIPHNEHDTIHVIMPADALAPSVAKSPAVIILSISIFSDVSSIAVNYKLYYVFSES